MGAARHGFFHRIERAAARFFAGRRSKALEITSLFLAFAMDAVNMWQIITCSQSKTRDIGLSVAPLSCFFLGTLLFCCFPGRSERDDPPGVSAMSFFGNSGYLLSRTALDLSLALFVTDYQEGHDCNQMEELIINASECGIELIYLLYVIFEHRLTQHLDAYFSRLLAEDLNYDALPYQI